jgi:FkbM family methyltransferase
VRIGGRAPRRVLAAPFQRDHYRAAAQMLRCYPDRLEAMRRYLGGGGDYPYRCRIRTPLGVVTATLHSSDDMLTVNEVFCRQDYRAETNLRVAVDLGANIGISALYFLTRSAHSQVYSWEPDPKNIARLRHNLQGFEDRYRLAEAAVALRTGTATFGVEPIGRYGTLELDMPTGHPPTDLIEVETTAIGEILEQVIAHHGQIDILKIDVEGTEEQLVASISDEHLARIETIVYETNESAPFHLDRFSHHFSTKTNRLERLG